MKSRRISHDKSTILESLLAINSATVYGFSQQFSPTISLQVLRAAFCIQLLLSPLIGRVC